MSFERLGIIALALLLLSACSVKENRSDCPCHLSVSLSGAPLKLRISGEDCLIEQDIPKDTLLVVLVPKGRISVAALRGADYSPDGSVRIPYGYDSPPVFIDVRELDTSGEAAEASLCPYKSFCALDIDFDSPPGGGEPYRVDIRGEVDGWNPDGSLSGGDYSFRFVPDSEGRTQLRLPRQMDSSLMMDILFDDKIVRTFALGETIAGSGYDWCAQSLEDLSLTLKLSLMAFGFSAELWKDEVKLEILI